MTTLKVSVVREHPSGVRYRAGIRFDRTVREYDMDQAQAEAVAADPWLEVEHITGPDAPPAPRKPRVKKEA